MPFFTSVNFLRIDLNVFNFYQNKLFHLFIKAFQDNEKAELIFRRTVK